MKKWKVAELRWWFGAWWLWLYSPEYTCQPFLPSCYLPLNLINKDEFLSIMKFTLNHKFVNGHHDRSSNKMRFWKKKKRASLMSLLRSTWGCKTTVLLKTMMPSILVQSISSWAMDMLGVLHDDLCTNQSTNTSNTRKSGKVGLFSK